MPVPVGMQQERVKALEKLLAGSRNEGRNQLSVMIGEIRLKHAPARRLLYTDDILASMSSVLSHADSGGGGDELCGWLYDCYQGGDGALQAITIAFAPLLSAIYLVRSSSGSDESEEDRAGYEAILLAFYTAEAKWREGKPVTLKVPTLSLPSIYHTPPPPSHSHHAPKRSWLGTRLPVSLDTLEQRQSFNTVQISAPLSMLQGVKPVDRVAVVSVALEVFVRKIADMPIISKFHFCTMAEGIALRGCSWRGVERVPYPTAAVEGDKHLEECAMVKVSLSPAGENASGDELPASGEDGKSDRAGEGRLRSDAMEHGGKGHGQGSAGASSASSALGEMRITTKGEASTSPVDRDSTGGLSVDDVRIGDGKLGADGFGALRGGACGGGGEENDRTEWGKEGLMIKQIVLSLELTRVLCKGLGHCFFVPEHEQSLRDAAASAVRALYIRSLHDTAPEGILMTRALLRLIASAQKSQPHGR